MMKAISQTWYTDLGAVGLERKQFIRSTLEEVYFVIHKYLYLVFGRTLSEYVY